MISIIGSAPSSGSTLLADLIDSSEFSACGEELDLFANRNFYDFNKFKKDPFRNSGTCSVYLDRTHFDAHNFYMYGFDEKKFLEVLANSSNQNELIGTLRNIFIEHRRKNSDCIWFEKTPQNINSIGEFLSLFNTSYFIYIVRNPLYVFSSMLNRGFTPGISLLTWFIAAAKFYKFKNHERAILVKYEDLVENPFRVTSDLLSRLSKRNISSDSIKESFSKNTYRKEHVPRIDSWGVSDYGTIRNANTKKLDKETIALFCKYQTLKINKGYATKFGLSEMSFSDLIEEYGYSAEVNELIKDGEMTTLDLQQARKRHFIKNGNQILLQVRLN